MNRGIRDNRQCCIADAFIHGRPDIEASCLVCLTGLLLDLISSRTREVVAMAAWTAIHTAIVSSRSGASYRHAHAIKSACPRALPDRHHLNRLL